MEKEKFPISLQFSAPVEELRAVIGELNKIAFFKMFVAYIESREVQIRQQLTSLDPSEIPAEQFAATYATMRGRFLEREAMVKIVKGEI